MKTIKRTLLLAGATAALVAAAIATLTGYTPGDDTTGHPTHAAPPTADSLPTTARAQSSDLLAAGLATVDETGAVHVDAAAVLELLEVRPIAATLATGYDRDLFGQRWADIDRNGCDTRNDVLRRDLVDLSLKPNTNDCVVLTGELADPLTGATIQFERGDGTSQLVQIDHVVPLAWAWRHGADRWDEQLRLEFANDPTNLQAVDGAANASKSDAGPGDWMPANEAFHCEYSARFVLVVDRYELAIDQADRDQVRGTLSSCGR